MGLLSCGSRDTRLQRGDEGSVKHKSDANAHIGANCNRLGHRGPPIGVLKELLTGRARVESAPPALLALRASVAMVTLALCCLALVVPSAAWLAPVVKPHSLRPRTVLRARWLCFLAALYVASAAVQPAAYDDQPNTVMAAYTGPVVVASMSGTTATAPVASWSLSYMRLLVFAGVLLPTAASTKTQPAVVEGVPAHGESADNSVVELTVALRGLSDQQSGFEIVRASELTMTKMFDDMVATYQDQTELLTGVAETALKYRRVHGEATNVVAAVGESASQMVTWLPKFKELVKERNAKAAQAVLKKLAREMVPVAARFDEYSKAHEEVRNEVEAHASKATELEKTAEWKHQVTASATWDATGKLIPLNVKMWPCEKLYPGRLPSSIKPDRDGNCKVEHDPKMDVSKGSFLSSMGLGAAAPVAFMAGGPAGMLALGSIASLTTFFASMSYSAHMSKLQADFARIRMDLGHVHETLTAQIAAFHEIQNRLDRAAATTDTWPSLRQTQI